MTFYVAVNVCKMKEITKVWVRVLQKKWKKTIVDQQSDVALISFTNMEVNLPQKYKFPQF